MTDASLGLRPWIARVSAGATLDADEASRAFDVIMSGNATSAQTAGFLMALAVRGETVAELAGGARSLRSRMRGMNAPAGAMDIVGTGGDGKGTLNISTATALVVAGCGVTVAKHGNRAASSRSGTADVLAALGVDLDAGHETVQRAIDEAGIGFMLAPLHHSAMRHVAPVRQDLGVRTIFNLLGPLANPARVGLYLMGVATQEWAEPFARVLHELGATSAWVVHSDDGCDELTLTSDNHVVILAKGTVRTTRVSAADAGLDAAPFEAIAGGSPEDNATALTALLEGAPGAFRDTVLLNAAAALCVARHASTLPRGVALARRSIDSGAARQALQRLVAITCGNA